MLDIGGAVFACLQNVFDALYKNDLGVITGNLPKLGISLGSTVYDCIILMQHFLMYRSPARHKYAAMSLELPRPPGLPSWLGRFSLKEHVHGDEPDGVEMSDLRVVEKVSVFKKACSEGKGSVRAARGGSFAGDEDP